MTLPNCGPDAMTHVEMQIHEVERMRKRITLDPLMLTFAMLRIQSMLEIEDLTDDERLAFSVWQYYLECVDELQG